MIPRETDLTRQDSSRSDRANNFKGPSSSSATSSNWSKLKDPRIVRVSKAFGGKDRHSKVCTVRGLRDRRVRLSVNTAIQLYDLQDRLGLSQPSKVVDWLLNAAKHEIDELPPLKIPPGSFQPMPLVSESDKQGLKVSGSPTINWSDPLNLRHPSRSGILGGKSKEVSGETGTDREETNWARNEEERRFSVEDYSSYHVSENRFLPRQNPSSLSSLVNTPIPYNSFIRWDPSNLSLSHPPRSNGLTAQPEDWHNFGLVPMSVPSGSHHQVLVYQPGMSVQPYLPPQVAATITGFDPKEMDFQSSRVLTSSALTSPVDSSTQPVGSIHFNTTANLLPSQDNDNGNEQNKGNI